MDISDRDLMMVRDFLLVLVGIGLCSMEEYFEVLIGLEWERESRELDAHELILAIVGRGLV